MGTARSACLLFLALAAGGCRDAVLQQIDADAAPVDIPGVSPADPNHVEGTLPSPFARRAAPNPIPAENRKPGEPLWRAGRHANNGQIELYLSTDSASVGDSFGVKVSTDGPQAITAEVFRLGDYAGIGARRIWSGGPYAADRQVACALDNTTARVECRWRDTLTLTVGADWVSGLYVVKVRRQDGFKRFAPLVVRDARAADVLFLAATNTYQAYNGWGGESLYQDAAGLMPSRMAWEASYDRPYLDDEGSGQLLRWEHPLAAFLERHGYDVTYVTNLDFDRYSTLLEGVGAFVHGGHDEYWTAAQRREVDRALAGGKVSLAYFGANGGYWRVRLSSGGRTLVCFKADTARDPFSGSTVRFRDPPAALPENALFGVMYEGWQLVPFPLTVADDRHWLFEGTGLTRGTQLTGLVGFEYDRLIDNGFTPPGLELPFESPVVSAEGVPSRSHAVARTLPSGRLVFAAGTLYWALGLNDDPRTHDARVERMTLNVMERALSHRRPPRALPPASGPIPIQPAPIGRWARAVDRFAGQEGVGGFRDGPANQARFNGPTGLAATVTGEVVVADTQNARIRLVRADPQRTVLTVAGTGQAGARDGPGAQAMFRAPTGVAVGPDGVIYVADSDNQVIRRIENNPPAYTVSTYAGAFRQPGNQDGPAALARFRRPTALALDLYGNLYIADQAAHQIRFISAGTRQVMTLAGNGSPGFADAPSGGLASFNSPSAVTLSPLGEIFVLDAGNQRLRRVGADAARGVVTLAGRADDPFGYADGPGELARFRAQLGLAFSPFGEVMVADTANFRIRKVVPGADVGSTVVYTHAGSGALGTRLGTGEQADLVAPTGLAYLPGGLLIVSDSFNHVLRAVQR